MPPTDVARDLALLQAIRPYKHLAVVGLAGVDAIFPTLVPFIRSKLPSDDIQTTLIPVGADGTLGEVPADIDAAFVLPLPIVSEDGRRAMYGSLRDRGITAVPLMGRPEVVLGAYASTAPMANMQKLGRRVALNISRIFDGRDPATFSTRIDGYNADVVFNMDTIRRMGVYPSWDLLATGIALNATALPTDEQLTIQAAIAEGLEHNFDLQSTQLDIPIAAENVVIARSNLLPRLTADSSLVLLDEETTDAARGSRNRLSWSAGLELQQVVYAESAWANHHIQKLLKRAAELGVDDAELQVVRDVTEAYLGVLQATNLVELQNENVGVSKQNYDLALARKAVGGGSDADIKRWESQLALGQMDAVDAEITLNSARRNLNRVLGRPLESPPGVVPLPLEAVMAIFLDPRMQGMVSDAGAFARFTDFLASEVMRGNPQLKSIDQAAAAQARQVTMLERGLYIPQVVLQGNVDYLIDSWGEPEVQTFNLGGQEVSLGGSPIEDPTWSVALALELPLFTGLGNYAEIRRARHELVQIEQDKRTAAQGLETQMRIATMTVGRQFAKIRLSRKAAEASREALRIVQEGYASGAFGITQVIDAQNAALQADILAANTVYDFLSAFLDVERTRGQYGFLEAQSERDAFIERFKSFRAQQQQNTQQ